MRYFSSMEIDHFEELKEKIPIIPWMENFNAERERYFWFTHLFLFIGFGFPYLFYGPDPTANIGVILAIGDATAAFMGKKYGK